MIMNKSDFYGKIKFPEMSSQSEFTSGISEGKVRMD